MQNQKQVKRFVAPSMTRALDLVREEMGPEAIILSSKRTPEGVEIVTSIETDEPTRGVEDRREFSRHFDDELDTALSSDSAWKQQAKLEKMAEEYTDRAEVKRANFMEERNGADLAREIERARERMIAAKREARERENTPVRAEERRTTAEERRAVAELRDVEAYTPPVKENTESAVHISQQASFKQHDEMQKIAALESRKQEANEEKLHNLQAEIADMRLLLEQQLWQMGDNQQGLNSIVPQQLQLPPEFSALTQRLNRLGLEESLSQDLMASVGKHERVSEAWRACMVNLSKRIPVVSGDLVDNGGIFAFVGPTGVGKTTTIAKLAARYVLEHGPGKVALITTDTYRVGAYDQLRSLGKILNVPVRAVEGENSLLTLIASLRKFPLILIDTAGFRQGDPLLQDQLAKLDSCQAIRRVLVMSCNSQAQSLVASTHAYASRRGIDACVLSKVDECASLGEAIGVVVKKQIPLAYTTNGQEIPKDIDCASGHNVVVAAVNIMKGQASENYSAAGA